MLAYVVSQKFGDAGIPLPKVAGPCSTVKIMLLPQMRYCVEVKRCERRNDYQKWER